MSKTIQHRCEYCSNPTLVILQDNIAQEYIECPKCHKKPSETPPGIRLKRKRRRGLKGDDGDRDYK